MLNRYEDFLNTIWSFYESKGRHDLPWRLTVDPYQILVSEIMLQQTQVDRVIPKYQAFLKRFPTIAELAAAPLADVLIIWQGLGYNRRAKMLHECAKAVQQDYGGTLPHDETKLRALPGIGPYTARAILAFAFDIALPLIETNVRTVYIHHFFPDATDITDTELWPHIEATLSHEKPRDWYYALMDYGSYLKRTVGNNVSKSKQYTKQSTFKGSDRQIRGAIIRLLTTGSYTYKKVLEALVTYEDVRVAAQLERLIEEGLAIKQGRTYSLPSH
ncbi:MAG: A/G-specific adenine glycosylase [Candidatus Pacebacteria bacterium]|jgi:A/G-specific adenine glycosylase|nr:A/G-specific adenine glycosylase [Candidatus Paceibacterota bacterium]